MKSVLELNLIVLISCQRQQRELPTGKQIKIDLSPTNPIVLMNAINDGFAQTKASLQKKDLLLERTFGI